jgi:hypothetical protein
MARSAGRFAPRPCSGLGNQRVGQAASAIRIGPGTVTHSTGRCASRPRSGREQPTQLPQTDSEAQQRK